VAKVTKVKIIRRKKRKTFDCNYQPNIKPSLKYSTLQLYLLYFYVSIFFLWKKVLLILSMIQKKETSN